MKVEGEHDDTKLGDKNRVLRIIELLEKEHPDAGIVLNYADPLELLIATILSAQCTDRSVNFVTETLFRKYRGAKSYGDADLKELEADIRSAGFYRNKARNIKRCCQLLVKKFNSQVPRTMAEMLELPGVARKTANVVLSNAYGVLEGIAVDTHVRRIARRLGLSKHENPNKIEKDLMAVVPKQKWMKFTDLLIFHGRRTCIARRPRCESCVLRNLCPSAFTF